MQVNLDVYKFAIKNLKETFKVIVNCQKQLINYYQEEIDKIKKNESYTKEEKTKKIQEFLSTINEVHSALRKNNSIINSILGNINELENNLKVIENKDVVNKNDSSVEEQARNLMAVVKKSCDRIYSISEEANEMLKKENDTSGEEKNVILENELQKMYRLSKETNEVLSGIKISDNDDDNKTISKLNDYLAYEIDRTNYISEEAAKLLAKNKNEIFEDNLLDNFIKALKNETKNIKNRIVELEDLLANDNERTEIVAITLLQNILEDEYQKIVSAIYKLEMLTEGSSEQKKITFDENKYITEKHDMQDVLSRQVELIGDNNDDLTSYLLELKNGDYTSREIVKKLRDLYNEHIKNIENISLETEELLEKNAIDKEQKTKDTAEYKKYSSVLNESFWSSRQRASEEGIKYPSALYENKVKEYQNEYLIEKYSITLEEVESYIEKYKEKYADDIYKDEIYEMALYQLRRETNKTVKELCDDTEGLSLLDTKARQLIENDLLDIIREIRMEKINNENNNTVFNDYRKNMTINKLIAKKEIIEHQLAIIKLREKRIKENM